MTRTAVARLWFASGVNVRCPDLGNPMIGCVDYECIGAAGRDTNRTRSLKERNKEVKLLIYTILKQIIEREKEALAAKQKVVERLEEKINCIDCESDELEFIEGEVGEYSNPSRRPHHDKDLCLLKTFPALLPQHSSRVHQSISCQPLLFLLLTLT
jgi:hypothetical protein